MAGDIDKAMEETKRRRLASQERKDKARAFASSYIRMDQDVVKASVDVGISPSTGRQLLHVPEVREMVDESLSEAARAAGIDATWFVKRLVDVVERCMQAEQVLDKDGKPTGEYAFNASGANQALKMIGQHLRALGVDDKSAATQVGNAVIRLLAQEAQASRTHVDTSAAAASPENPGPSRPQGISLAPGMADGPSVEAYTPPPQSPPVS